MFLFLSTYPIHIGFWLPNTHKRLLSGFWVHIILNNRVSNIFFNTFQIFHHDFLPFHYAVDLFLFFVTLLKTAIHGTWHFWSNIINVYKLVAPICEYPDVGLLFKDIISTSVTTWKTQVFWFGSNSKNNIC